MGTTYTVSDGKMMLVLEVADEGGYIVTSPLDPQLITQAETLEEAFVMADDAAEGLAIGRNNLAGRLRPMIRPEPSGLKEVEPVQPEGSPNARTRKKGDRAEKP